MTEKFYFSDENIFDKISDILSKNGVAESPEDASLKGREAFIIKILHLTKNYLGAKITKKDSVLLIEKELNIPHQSAESIFKEIETNIIPLAIKITISDPNDAIEENKKPEMPSNLSPINSMKILDNPPTPKPQEQKNKDAYGLIEKPEKIRKTTLKEEKNTQMRQKSGRDNYREPIE